MNFIKNNLANAFTLGNLFSGCVGAIQLLEGDYITTGICIIISLILDFFDGFVARAMKSNSDLGVQLDSLADMVSFGLIPGLTMYMALEGFGYNFMGATLPFEVKYLGLFITLFSCLRLAIFNIDTEQKYYFKGLNTPSNTILVFGLYYAFNQTGAYEFLFNNELLLVILTALCSGLLVSPVKMIANKFKSKELKDNLSKILFVIGAILLLVIFKVVGIPLVIIYYIILSIIFQKELSSLK